MPEYELQYNEVEKKFFFEVERMVNQFGTQPWLNFACLFVHF